MPEPFNIQFTLGVSLVAVYFAIIFLMTKRMKDFHYDAWDKDLGRFSLFLNNSMRTGFLFIRYFIFTNRYRTLNDETLDKMTIAARVTFAVFFANFAWGLYLVAHPTR